MSSLGSGKCPSNIDQIGVCPEHDVEIPVHTLFANGDAIGTCPVEDHGEVDLIAWV